MSQQIKVVVPENYDPAKPIIIHILEGNAPEPVKTIQQKAIAIIGTIFAPGLYAANIATEQKFQNEEGIVFYSTDPKAPYIELVLNQSTDLPTFVKGELKPNKDVEAFKFNTDAVFTNKSFSDFIMKFSHCFATKGAAKELKKSLQNFQAEFKTAVKKADDKQGNTEDYIATELDRTKANIPDQIHLKMPLFEGGDDVEFTAEVEITVTMSNDKPEARFGFFTLDLTDQMRKYTQEVIKKEVEGLSQKFTCIQK